MLPSGCLQLLLLSLMHVSHTSPVPDFIAELHKDPDASFHVPLEVESFGSDATVHADLVEHAPEHWLAPNGFTQPASCRMRTDGWFSADFGIALYGWPLDHEGCGNHLHKQVRHACGRGIHKWHCTLTEIPHVRVSENHNRTLQWQWITFWMHKKKSYDCMSEAIHMASYKSVAGVQCVDTLFAGDPLTAH